VLQLCLDFPDFLMDPMLLDFRLLRKARKARKIPEVPELLAFRVLQCFPVVPDCQEIRSLLKCQGHLVLPGFLLDLDFPLVLSCQFLPEVQPLQDFPGNRAHRMVLRVLKVLPDQYYRAPPQDLRYHWHPEDHLAQQILCFR